MFSWTSEFSRIVEKYPQWNVLVGVEKHPELGQLPRYHMDHTELFRECEELQTRERWYQQAKQQMFVADVKAEIKVAKPVVLKTVALTVRPEDGSLQTCQEIVSRIKEISAVKSMVYVFEQKAEDPEGDPFGWHIHAAVMTTYAPTHIKSYVAQKTYKCKKRTLVCSVHTSKADSRWLENYMAGNKFMDSKDAACSCDVIFREKLGLQSSYSFSREK